MKKLILLFLLVSPTIGWSEELKLRCKINLITTYSWGEIEKEQFNEVFEIMDYGKQKIILSQSDNFWSIDTTDKRSHILSIKDFSDSNKWDIIEELRTKNGDLNSINIKIDRNIGTIWYSEVIEKNGKTTSRRGDGECEKVNMSKKKF